MNDSYPSDGEEEYKYSDSGDEELARRLTRAALATKLARRSSAAGRHSETDSFPIITV